MERKFENKFEVDIIYTKASFKGIRSIYFTGLQVTTKTNKPIFQADSVSLGIKPFAMLFGKIRISDFSMYNSHTYLDFELMRYLRNRARDEKIDTIKTPVVNYAGTFNSIQSKFFSYLPKKMLMRNCSLHFRHDTIEAVVMFENFSLQKNKLKSDILFTDRHLSSECLLEGFVYPNKKEFNIKISRSDSDNVKLPYLGDRWQAGLGFDTLKVYGKIYKSNSKVYTFSGQAEAQNLSVFFKQIGPDTVITKAGKFEYLFNIGTNYAELDSNSVVQINRFSFSPYIQYLKRDTSAKITVAFIYKEFNAQDFFSSLPAGLFSNFSGFETEGNLAYRMKSVIDLGLPDSSTFDSKLESKGFKIKKYGITDFRMLNGPFYHEVYENDRLVNRFMVGPENPEFVSINEISPYLKYSILTSEDGDFFYHRGFNQKAFCESIAKNIKEKRFARGGSTITMQLVKNVFLIRKKTISRKIEEALIVWMIENLHLSSKERMYEVYLNIIEWGPGVYGIKPAARFYFDKQPSELTLSESIYLSSLIPRPKGFKYTFDKEGKLREYLTPYYQLLSSIMLRRNQITPDDTTNLKPIAELTGDARSYLAKPDSTIFEDSLFFTQPDLFPATGEE
jgi:hypothetical protein